MSDDELSGAIVTALRRANPVPDDQVAGRRSLPSAHALFAEIVSQPPRRVRPRRAVAFAVVVAVIAAAVAAFAVVQRDDSSPELSVACYAKASLATGTASIVTPSLGNPVKACAALWAA